MLKYISGVLKIKRKNNKNRRTENRDPKTVIQTEPWVLWTVPPLVTTQLISKIKVFIIKNCIS